MRIQVYVDNNNIRVLLEVPTAELKKYRKWLICFIASSLPLVFAYSKAINNPTLPEPPAIHQHQQK